MAEDADDTDEDLCPICGSDGSCSHLLGSFDVTFPGQGKLGAGLSGGALYDNGDLENLIDCVQLSAAAAYLEAEGSGTHGAVASARLLVQRSPALTGYFDEFVAACSEAEIADDIEEFRDQVLDGYDFHNRRIIELIKDLLREIGSGYSESEWEDDVPLASSSYLSLWTADAEKISQELSEHIRAVASLKLLGDLIRSELVRERGKKVAVQCWDSGGPGAGAGEVCVYEFGGFYFAENDVEWYGPYEELQEAIAAVQLDHVTDATKTITIQGRRIFPPETQPQPAGQTAGVGCGPSRRPGKDNERE
jgi:hypothetical protein